MVYICRTCGGEFHSTRALGEHYREEPAHRPRNRAAGDASYERLKAHCQGATIAEVLRVARDMLDEQIEMRQREVKRARVIEDQLRQLEKQRSQVAELVMRQSEAQDMPAGQGD